jgi:hypothetical protein
MHLKAWKSVGENAKQRLFRQVCVRYPRRREKVECRRQCVLWVILTDMESKCLEFFEGSYSFYDCVIRSEKGRERRGEREINSQGGKEEKRR